jgi:integrase
MAAKRPTTARSALTDPRDRPITSKSGQAEADRTLHGLRHSFAVRTLLEWYRAGEDVDTRLAWLSTYLGHRDPRSTYWYLSATPELLAMAADRLEAASTGMTS